jgi:hypothetical protein
MKRLLKFLLNLIMALMAVGLTLLILFFLNPSWQKSVVENVLAQDSARQWQLGSVRVQPSGLEVEKIFVLDGSVGAEAQFLRLMGPFWKFPLDGVLEISSGEVAGLNVDLSRIRIGDPTSEDYQNFLGRVSGDQEFWEERVALVLSKFSAAGIKLRIRDLQLGGKVLMRGNKVVPVRWMILEADSHAPRMIRMKPYPDPPEEL